MIGSTIHVMRAASASRQFFQLVEKVCQQQSDRDLIV
jgi:hypothetical protein